MLSIATIIVRSLAASVIVQAPSTATAIAVVRVSPPRGLPGQDGADGADGQDGSPYALATQAEMEAGILADPRSMSPALIAAAIAALSSGGGLDLPLSLAQGGTGSQDAPSARLALGIEEVIPAVAQVVLMSLFSDFPPDVEGAYFDLPTTTEVVRVWLQGGEAVAPEVPVNGRLLAVSVGADAAETSLAVVAALEADAAFHAESTGPSSWMITNAVAGAVITPYSTPSNAFLSGVESATGADAYRRLTALDGRQLTNVDAHRLEGYAAVNFALSSHSHAYTQITNRPLFATTAVDVVTNSTTLSNLLTASVVSGKTYLVFASGVISTTATTEGSCIAVNGPSASGINFDFTLPTNGIGGETNGNVTAWETKFTNISGPGSTARGRWIATGRFVASANGTFAIRVSAETGGANTVIWRAGSILILCPIN